MPRAVIRNVMVAVVLLWAGSAWATVAVNVNQTHTLTWQWEPSEGPVRSFVFRCGPYRKDVLGPETRSLYFSALVDGPGTYTGCTMSASNEAGLSAPVAVPDFHYAYSYGALCRLLLELAATFGAFCGIVGLYGRRVMVVLLTLVNRLMPARRPLALSAPPLILTKETEHVYRYR